MNELLDPKILAKDVRPAQNGDPDAMNRLLVSVQDMVYYSCLRMLRSEAEAQDASQDVLITVYRRLGSLSDPLSFLGWVKRIAANCCKDRLSKTNREFLLNDTEEGQDAFSFYEDLDEQRVPDKALDNAETRRMINELIDRLPDEQRVCVILYYFNEMKTREIAESLGVSEGTVKSRLNYARKAIKEGVEGYEKQGIKLYGLSPLLFLGYFLRKAGSLIHAPFTVTIPGACAGAASGASAAGTKTASSAAGRTVSAGAKTAANAGARTAASAASKAAAGAAAKTAASSGFGAFLSTAAGKIVAAVAITAVLGGAVTGTVFAVKAASEKADRAVETSAQASPEPGIAAISEGEQNPFDEDRNDEIRDSDISPNEEIILSDEEVTVPDSEIPEPAAETATKAKLIKSYESGQDGSSFEASYSDTMFTCDLDGDGAEEEISYHSEAWDSITVTAGDVVIMIPDEWGILGIRNAFVVDLDPESSRLHLAIIAFTDYDGDKSFLLHLENGELTVDFKGSGNLYFDEEQLFFADESTEALGTRGPGCRALIGDSLTPDSEWYESRPNAGLNRYYRNADPLHLVRDLPCTIDGVETVIPKGSDIYYYGILVSEEACKVMTSDGRIAIVKLEKTGSWPVFNIDGIPQDDYFENLEYYG